MDVTHAMVLADWLRERGGVISEGYGRFRRAATAGRLILRWVESGGAVEVIPYPSVVCLSLTVVDGYSTFAKRSYWIPNEAPVFDPSL